MKQNVLGKLLLMGAVTSVFAFAEMTVDKAGGTLTISSNAGGQGTAVIVGPDNKVVVKENFRGTFTWSPNGPDGAYSYDVRVGQECAGGSVEVINGAIYVNKNKGVPYEK